MAYAWRELIREATQVLRKRWAYLRGGGGGDGYRRRNTVIKVMLAFFVPFLSSLPKIGQFTIFSGFTKEVYLRSSIYFKYFAML